MSDRFELNKEDYKRILRQIVIIYSPVIYISLDQMQSWNFDWNVIWALIISTTIDVARRYLTNYTK